MELDDWTLINVYCRPNANADPALGYWPAARAVIEDIKTGELTTVQTTFKDVFLDACAKRGMSKEDALARFHKLHPQYRG